MAQNVTVTGTVVAMEGADVSTTDSQWVRCEGDGEGIRDEESGTVQRGVDYRAASKSSEELVTALLGAPKEDATKWSRKRRWATGICGTLLLAFLALVVFLYTGGYFDKIDRNVIIDGDEAVEPNTQMRFPMVTVDPTTKEKLHLVGLFLKAESVLGVNLRAYCVATYVNQQTARRLLSPWRHLGTSAPSEEMIKLITDGTSISGRLEYRMLMTIPSSSTFNFWSKEVHEILKQSGTDSDMTSDADSLLHSWISKGFKDKDHLKLIWGSSNLPRERNELGAGKPEVSEMICIKNNKQYLPVEKSRPLIHAMIYREIHENGHQVINMLSTLWQDFKPEQISEQETPLSE